MRAGVFSGPASAPVEELVDRVRNQPPMLGADLCGEVSTVERYIVEPEGQQRFTVAALDLGIKTNTPRNFALRGIRTHVLPSTATFDEISEIRPDGVFLSNGPGDPATADRVVAVTRQVLGAGIPLFGICFGNQILGRALGRSTYKMVWRAKRGRRSTPTSVRRSSATPVPTTVSWRESNSLTDGHSRCSTTPRRRRARMTPTICSTNSPH
jgi:carbamoyl-phosphate synthase small subunit